MEDNNTGTMDAVEGAETDAIEETDADVSVESETAEEAVRQFKKRLKLKVDGEEIEEEIDWNDEDGLTKKLQLAKAAQKRMAEAAQSKRQAEEFIRLLKSDPLKLLQHPDLGINFREMAEEYLAAQLEQEMLSPEQKQQKEMQEKLRQYEEQERTRKEEEESRRMQELEAQFAQDIQAKFIKALEGSGLPRSPKVIKRMAEMQYVAMQNGYDADPADLVEMVRESYQQEIKELFGQSDEQTLLKLMGEDVAGKLRKADLARIKNPTGAKPKSSTVTVEKSPKKKLSLDEWREQLDRKLS